MMSNQLLENDSFNSKLNMIRLTGCHYLVASAILLPISIYCNHVFLKADIFTSAKFTNAGFTNLEWFHLLVATYSYPIGKWSKLGKLILFHILFWVSIYCTYRSHNMANDLLSCGIFCFYKNGNAAPTDIGGLTSGQQWLGMLYFFTSLIYTFGIFIPFALLHVQFYVAYKNKGYDDDSTHSHERSSVLSLPLQSNGVYPGQETGEDSLHKGGKESLIPPLSRSDTKSSLYFILMIAVFLVMYPILIFACMALPTWWNNFTPNKIQSYRAINPVDNIGDDYNSPILKVGSYSVWNLGSESFPQFIFLFPDIIMYYTMIYFVVVVTLLSEIYPPLRSLLLSKTSFTRISCLSLSSLYDFITSKGPLVWNTLNLCVGEFLISGLLLSFFVCLFVYFYIDHAWQNGTLFNPSINNTENAARCMGQVANSVTGLLLLPVSRNSIWSLVFGIPGEAMIAYHKTMGAVWFITVFAHMLLWWTNFNQNGFFPQGIFSVPSPYHADNFTIPLSIITFFIAIILMGVFSNYWIRKYHHELFYWSHHFALVIFFVMLWHATMSWYYITAGLILYAVDHMIRFSRCIGISATLEYANVIDNSDSSIVFLSYRASMPSIFSLSKPKKFTYEMGQYVFINIPSVSIAEWHPFTISSGPSADQNIITHHIKVQGNTQWTGKLREYIGSLDRAMSTAPFKNVTINIDGPYGLPLQASQYNSILLIAGGIGITPMHSAMRELYHNIKYDSNAYPNLRRIRLVWVTKVNEKFFDYTWNMVLSDTMIGNGSTKLFSCAKYFTSVARNNPVNIQKDTNSQSSSNANSVNSIASSLQSSASSSNSSYNFYEYCEVYNGRPNLEREIFDRYTTTITTINNNYNNNNNNNHNHNNNDNNNDNNHINNNNNNNHINNNNNNNNNNNDYNSTTTGRTLVYSCGPKMLIESCEAISNTFSNVEFKKEYFDL